MTSFNKETRIAELEAEVDRLKEALRQVRGAIALAPNPKAACQRASAVVLHALACEA